MATSLEAPVSAPAGMAGRWKLAGPGPTRGIRSGASRWRPAAPLLLAIIIYLILSLWLARNKAPWCDEGWFANPAYNLAFRGNLGMNVLEPSGFHLNAYFRGIQQRTYLFPPNHMLALAGWFRLFGAGVFSMRLYSICWSAISLAVLFYLFSQFFPDRRVAALATLFTAVDFIFLWSSADGRTEASANALAWGAIAAYVYFREKSFPRAVISSQVLGAAAVFIHPNAAIVILILGLAAWRFDRKRFQKWHLALAGAPYLLFALLWGWYILQSPGDFRAQFLVHAAGHNSERLRILLRPDVAIGTEVARLMTAYYLGGLWAGVMKGWMTLIPCLYILAAGWFLGSWRRHPGLTRVFAAGAAALMLGMTFLNGFKGYFYLIYLVPIYNAMLAAWLLSMWRRKAPGKYAAAAAGLVFVAVQLSISILHIRADEYHRDYQPAIQDLARYRAEGKSIVGTAALGFGMGFSGFHDDVRLGLYSGLDPDVVVIDRSYRNFDRIIEQDEPSVFAHIVTALSAKYRLAAQHGSFWIFERARPAQDGSIAPWIDLGKLAMVQKGKRAEYFFRLIFSAAQLRDPEESSL